MVHNVHERTLSADPGTVGELIDSLAGPADRLWPREQWPAMHFDMGLQEGAAGGHGPIRYSVETYDPGRHVRFRFCRPVGFDGYHEFHVNPATAGGVVLRHSLVMRTTGRARLSWPVVFRPLHDALIEDALHKAAVELGDVQPRPRWGLWVRLLRRLLRRGRRAVPRQPLETSP